MRQGARQKREAPRAAALLERRHRRHRRRRRRPRTQEQQLARTGVVVSDLCQHVEPHDAEVHITVHNLAHHICRETYKQAGEAGVW